MKTEKKHTGFGIPEGYFSDLEQDIFRDVETHELEKNLKNKFGENHGLVVPEAYFESFNPRSNVSTKVFSISKVLKYSSAVAACIALFFFSGVFSTKSEQLSDLNHSTSELLAELTYDDIETLELFNTDELGELINDTEEEESLDEMLEYLLEAEDDLDEITTEILEI